MESLFVKFTNKYICFHSLFRVREEWNKGKLFKREKRLRITALKNDDLIFNHSDSILNQILNKPWLKFNILKFDSRLLIELIQSQVYSSFIQISIYSKMSKYTYWMILIRYLFMICLKWSYQFGTGRRPDVSLTAHWHVIIRKNSDCSSSPTCCFVTFSQVYWNVM